MSHQKNDDVKRSEENSRFQVEKLLDAEFSEEIAEELAHGNQSQGLMTSYGAETAKEKSAAQKLDRDY